MDNSSIIVDLELVKSEINYFSDGIEESEYYIDPSGNVTSAKADFTVEKADPTVNVEVEDIVYGDVEHIKVNVNARGNITVKVNGKVVYAESVCRIDDVGWFYAPERWSELDGRR